MIYLSMKQIRKKVSEGLKPAYKSIFPTLTKVAVSGVIVLILVSIIFMVQSSLDRPGTRVSALGASTIECPYCGDTASSLF